MKTINEGDPKIYSWWYEKRISCHNCGFVGELEASDRNGSSVLVGRDDVVATCPKCESTMKVTKK